MARHASTEGPDPLRADLADRYEAVRRCTEALAAPLCAEDQVVQSMPDVSPTKWHRAHVTWFFETFLLTELAEGYEAFDEQFRTLFNSYYEQVGEQYPRPRRGLVSRPTAREVGDYRRHVDDAMLHLIATVDDARWGLVAARTELGIHHEQQHQELLLMDIKHVLSCNPLDPTYLPSLSSGASASPTAGVVGLGWIDVDGGLVEIGHTGPGFGFDNERPRHPVHLEPFRIADRLVTNSEWLEFIDDGGYESATLWLSDGWWTVKESGWKAPLYWRREPDGSWTEFTLDGRRALDLAAPVAHISHYEADAFARWAGCRLPTEFEWEHAAAKEPVEGNLLDLDLDGRRAPPHPQPTGSGSGLRQVFGDVWEWTASAYLPYPGFRPATGAIGEYNGKFMSGQMVLRGGACVTPPDHVRPTYRNFFPPKCRWMFAGLRLASDA